MADRTDQQEGRRRFRLKVRPVETEDEIDEVEDVEDNRAVTAAKGRATPARRQQDEEEEEGNFITRLVRGLVEYFEGVRSELRKVAWPTREETRRLTIIVISTLIITSLVLGVISLLFTELFRIGLNSPLILIGFMVIAVGAGVIYSRMRQRSSSSY
jgi:preprotein translocase subunit SecE